MTIEELEALLSLAEDEHLEFKKARGQFDQSQLTKYCCALANERGGKLILGVTDAKPRRISGTAAFLDVASVTHELLCDLRLRVQVYAIEHPAGRVLVFDVPSRPTGSPLRYKDIYWMRSGESLVSMPEDHLKKIFAEDLSDFSAQVCAGATMEHLDPAAIGEFRRRLVEKQRANSVAIKFAEELLSDTELLVDGGVTNAALVLLGTQKALGRFLPQAEVIFEYRTEQAPGPAQLREEYRAGFFAFYDKLWKQIDARNYAQHFRDGFFVRDIKTFNEIVIRESILNAIAHRDYQRQESVFIRQFNDRIEIDSPGGFPDGVTLQNILTKQSPRNRRIADNLARCGLVERSGQGVDLMYRESIAESKDPPDYSPTDQSRVYLTLNGTVRDPNFVKYLERIGSETLSSFSTGDFILLDAIAKGKVIPEQYRHSLNRFRDLEVIELVGRGRGTRYILSKKFYEHLGEKGTYTRVRGLDRNTNKQLLLKHIRDNQKTGSQLYELVQVLPMLTVDQVKKLVKDLKAEGLVHCIGKKKAGRWYSVEG